MSERIEAGTRQTGAAPPFAVQAAGRCAPLARLVLSLGAEFRPVEDAAAEAHLERLAAALSGARTASPLHQCEACFEVLGGFRVRDDGPERLMLDAVLERREGHPILLGLVYAEVAGRAGIPLVPVGAPGLLLLGHVDGDEPFLLDPARPGALVAPCQVPARLRRRCSHEVAFAVLDGLMDAYAIAGDLRRAVRAAELRLALPLSGAALMLARRETETLRARLAHARGGG